MLHVAKEHLAQLLPAEERDDRDRVVRPGTPRHKLLAAALIDCVGLEPGGELGADEGAHAATGHSIDRDTCAQKLLEHPDVRERTGTATRENYAH